MLFCFWRRTVTSQNWKTGLYACMRICMYVHLSINIRVNTMEAMNIPASSVKAETGRSVCHLLWLLQQILTNLEDSGQHYRWCRWRSQRTFEGRGPVSALSEGRRGRQVSQANGLSSETPDELREIPERSIGRLSSCSASWRMSGHFPGQHLADKVASWTRGTSGIFQCPRRWTCSAVTVDSEPADPDLGFQWIGRSSGSTRDCWSWWVTSSRKWMRWRCSRYLHLNLNMDRHESKSSLVPKQREASNMVELF